jgi:hypothetical protein
MALRMQAKQGAAESTMAAERVEISGWDSSENFFVESVWMEAEGDGKALITLRSTPRLGSLVFLRHFSPSGEPRRTLTLPWRVLEVRPSSLAGFHTVRIAQQVPVRIHRAGA